MKYYNNRELAASFGINLAKWKRWSRAFLPPDPLGGKQSGYARQYHPNQAFAVHLGGHLVANMKFSIPDAARIIGDLHGWLKENGYFYGIRPGGKPTRAGQLGVKNHILFIEPAEAGGFHYAIRGVISKTPIRSDGEQVISELFTETTANRDNPAIDLSMASCARVFNLTKFLRAFHHFLDIDPNHYRVLS